MEDIIQEPIEEIDACDAKNPLALVINPQDCPTMKTFAFALYHGNWNKGVKFASHNQVQVDFAPELSGFSNFTSNQELAKKVSQLASFTQNSVNSLVDEGSLLKSMSKCLSSPCSGLVFVSLGTGNHVAELFDVLVNDIKSYKDEREKSEINYDLLRRGDLSETRFVLGKVILETLGVELVQKNVVKLEDIEKMCDSMVKLHPLAKNDVKSILELMGSSHSPDDKLNLLHKSMVKSRKRKTSDNLQDAVKENSAKPKGTSVEEKLFNVAKHHPVAKKDVKWILSPKRKIAFVENNHPSQQEMDIKKDKFASRNRCKEAFEKNLNSELSNLPAEKLLGKILEKFQQRKVSDRLQDSIKDKTTKLKEKLTNGKGSQSSQSSLFR